VTYIGDHAFIGSKGLTLVTVGSGLLSIGSLVFSGCTSITDFICTSDVNIKEELDLMETTKFNKNSTRVIGHAGLASLETANTREAFLYAARRSYYGIETDIRKTADGHFVCFHDPNLMDYAGLDITVEGSTLAELREVTLFDARKSGTTERGRKIPTLEEYVEICKEYGKECIIELKPRFAREDVIRIVDIVDSLGYLDHSVFISFYDDNLTYVREHRPGVRVALTFSNGKEGLFEKIIDAGFDVLISIVIIDQVIIDRFHAEGRLVYCYTVDQVDRAEQLDEWGVDFIITNRLE
jgi:glycerophosphoryl diester phosphodiesterase